MTKVLINQYSEFPPPSNGPDGQEKFQRGTVLFPLQYYLNNTVAPRYDLPVHWHTEFELLHVISGTYNIFVGGKTISLNKDDICFIPGKELHGDASEKGSALYESVVFDIELIRQHSYAPGDFINAVLNNVIILDNYIPSTNTAIASIVQNFFDIVKAHTEGYELISSGYLLLFLGELKKQHLYIEKKIIPSGKRKQAEQLDAVINLIRKNYNTNLSLEAMAESAGLSPKYFCRIFREATEHSPIEYLNWYRVNQACTRLRETKDKLSIIAADCGFNDFSYFIKMFKRYKGMTPLRYRNFDADQI